MSFPVPDFDDVTAAFGAPRAAYLTWEQIPEDLHRWNNRYHSVASSLFCNGGNLIDHGLKLKPSIDSTKAHRALRALLCSFEPKHEIKMGTVAVALRDWCEDATEEDRKQASKPVKPKVPAKSKKQKRAKARIRRTA